MAELLQVKNLIKYFPLTRGVITQRKIGTVHAVDDVSFSIDEGKTLGLVGESGCGKSTVGRAILRLLKVTSGQLLFEGEDILDVSGRALKALRKKMQVVFQDPFASLNPRMTIGDIVSEPLVIHDVGTKISRRGRVAELLEIVGLKGVTGNSFPHELSGGQRQRVGIARALALNPKFLVLDEPMSALDVSIQAQIINLLKDLQERFDLTYLFIAHDLSVVKYIADNVAVMYLGKIVEFADKVRLYVSPSHPYTQSLLSAVPIPDPRKGKERKRIILKGDVPSPIDLPSGCRFHPRCPIAQEVCSQEEPELKGMAKNHLAACHFAKPNPIPV